MSAPAVTDVQQTPAERALSRIETFLVDTTNRQMCNRTEVQNLALDLHLILDPLPDEMPEAES